MNLFRCVAEIAVAGMLALFCGQLRVEDYDHWHDDDEPHGQTDL